MAKTAQDIMTRDVHTVSPQTSLETLAKAFADTKVSGFPVVDDAGDLLGVVTESDLIHQSQRLHIPTVITLFDSVIVLGSSKKLEDEVRRLSATTVEEIMTRQPLTVSPATPVTEIAALMAEKSVYTLPVVDAKGKLVGVIGKLDVIRATAEA